MNDTQTKRMTYNDLPSFMKQKLWNNKGLTFQISRDKVDEPYIEIKIINNETNNTKSAK
jgi:hypothetical protein